jgi:hypothetical protein
MNADALPHLRSYQWQRIFESVQSSFAPPPLETYLARAGDPPPPPTKKLEVREHLQPTDWLIPILFVALLAVSLSHMITFAGELAHAVYKSPPVQFLGWWLDRELFVVLHQAAFFVFSEVGVLFFYTRHCLSRSRGFSASLFSAAACALIAIYANVYAMVSGGDVLVGGFIGLLVPLLTMLLGERLAEVIRGALVDRRKRLDAYALQVAQHEERRAQMRQRYEADLERAARAAQDPIQLFHAPESLRLIAQRVVETYKNSALGKQIDWSLNDELFVARREISRYLALYQAMQVVPEPSPSGDQGAGVSESQGENLALNPSLDDKAEKLKRLLQENEAYRGLSGRQLAQRLVEDGHFEALTPQYVNKVRKTLDKN